MKTTNLFMLMLTGCHALCSMNVSHHTKSRQKQTNRCLRLTVLLIGAFAFTNYMHGQMKPTHNNALVEQHTQPTSLTSNSAFSLDTHTLPDQTLCQPSKNWQENISHHHEAMDKATHELLIAQYTTYAQGAAPKIADPAVKNIPIVESEEPLIDVKEMNESRITMLATPEHAFASPDCHSGFAASSKMRRTVFVKLQAMVKQLDIIAPYFGYKPGQISIKVFEGLRDLQTQEMLFNNKAKEIQDANPTMTEDEVFNETSQWVSPVRNNIPVHSTGGAVDIRLWDNRAQHFVDMGPFGVIWGKNTIAPTFSEDLTDVQRNNRLYQMVAATQAGLINYLYEYWHFSSGDRYASFWQEQDTKSRNAVYGPVK